jgi:hypothetical protein
MYRKKSQIIHQIEEYHKKVASIYEKMYEHSIYVKTKTLLSELIEHETERAKYLEKHIAIAEAINCWMDFPCDKLTNQINDCLKNINLSEDVNIEDIFKLELHFDNCLIKLYSILSTENALSENMTNIFYYMLKKTKKDETLLLHMLNNLQKTG